MANVLLGSIYFEKFSLLTVQTGKFLLPIISSTDKQTKLATWKLVMENLLVCKGLKC